MNDFLKETKCIDFSNPLILQKIQELKQYSATTIEYIKNAYEFVRDEIAHSWDIRTNVVSKTAGEVLQNKTGICWAKSCLLASLLRGNNIASGISYQKLTRGDDNSDGYIIHALNTVFLPEQSKWIRLDARGNKSTVHAEFSIDKEILAFAVRPQFGEIDYHDNNLDLDSRLAKILNEVDVVMNIRTDFECDRSNMMGEIRYIKTSEADIELLMQVRLEMLREVNDLSDEYVYDETLVTESRKYFENGNQTTVLAFDNEIVVGCASLSYIWIMPTFDHPTGTRAHLMNVYTKSNYRRKGISKRMVEMLIDEAKKKGVTEISLDATEMGRPLYEALGFEKNCAGMVLELR